MSILLAKIFSFTAEWQERSCNRSLTETKFYTRNNKNVLFQRNAIVLACLVSETFNTQWLFLILFHFVSWRISSSIT